MEWKQNFIHPPHINPFCLQKYEKYTYLSLLILYVCPLTKKRSVYHFNGRFIWAVRDIITTTKIRKRWFEWNKYLIPFNQQDFWLPGVFYTGKELRLGVNLISVCYLYTRDLSTETINQSIVPYTANLNGVRNHRWGYRVHSFNPTMHRKTSVQPMCSQRLENPHNALWESRASRQKMPPAAKSSIHLF